MKMDVVLTVSESKTLIAKGVASLNIVKERMKRGMIVIAKGTTNSYVVEELLGREIDKRAYVSGALKPAVRNTYAKYFFDTMPAPLPDIVLRDGKIAKELNRFSAVKEMGRGDIYIKGGNALDYRNKQVGILIGSSVGGTIGRTLGHIIGKKIHLILPIGLEKLVYEDLGFISRKLAAEDSPSPGLWVVTGTIITEIEALKILTGVDATLIAAGGTGGAEGCVNLLLEGNREQMDRVKKLMDSIHGEPPFGNWIMAGPSVRP